MAQKIEIVVTGNVGNAVTQLDKVGASLKKLPGASNSAAFALQNVGRVAQDVPFGFIGIQNNLNPLLESFQRLKAETGSTGGALKALGSSLMGAGGLGFALSIASAAFLIFSNGIQSFSRSSSSAKSGVDQLSESFYEFNNVIADSKQAIEDFNRQAEFLDKLADINLRVNVGDDFSRNITRLHQQVLTSLDEIGLLEDKVSKAFDNSNKAYDRFLNNASSNAKKLAATTGNLDKIPDELIESLSQADQRLIKNSKKTTEDLVELQGKRDKALKDRKLIIRELDAVREENSRKEIEKAKQLAEAEAKRLANLPTVQKAIDQLTKELAFLNTKELAFKTDETKAKVSAIQHTIENLFKKFGLEADNPLVIDWIFKAKDIQERTDLRKEIFKLFPEGGLSIPIKPVLTLTPGGGKKPDLKPLINPIKEQFEKEISVVLNSMNAQILEGVGKSLGDALTGGDIGKELFGGIFDVLGSALQQLGKIAIETGIGIKAIKIAFETLNPFVAIAAGVGLIALGQIIKNSVGNIKGLATGGSNLQGGFYDVGERGRERVYLPQGSMVVPNHQIQGSGGTQVFIPAIAIRGSDLLLTFNRASQQAGRNS